MNCSKYLVVLMLCLGIFFSQTARADVLMNFQYISIDEHPSISFDAVFTDFNDITNGVVLNTNYISQNINDPSNRYILQDVFFWNPGVGYGYSNDYRVAIFWYDPIANITSGPETSGWNGPFDHYGFYYTGPFLGTATRDQFTLSEYTPPPITPAPVPEPSTMLMLGSGLAGLVGYGRKRMKK